MKKYTLHKLSLLVVMACSAVCLSAFSDDSGSFEKLQAARQKALDALYGTLPGDTPKGRHEQWKESQKILAVDLDLHMTLRTRMMCRGKGQGLRAFYQSLFGNFWNASAFGHGRGFGDRDATPE